MIGRLRQCLCSIEDSRRRISIVCTMRFLRVGRPRQVYSPRLRDLAHLDEILDPGKAIAPVLGPTQWRFILHAHRGAPREVVRCAGEQDASVARKRHDTRCNRFGQSLDLQRLCPARHIVWRVFAKHDFAEVNTDPRGHSRIERGAKLAQLGLIGERETNRLDGPLEQQEEAIALVDFSAVESRQEVTCEAVVTRQQIGSGRVPDALDELRAGDEIAQQQRADRGIRSTERGRHGCRHE